MFSDFNDLTIFEIFDIRFSEFNMWSERNVEQPVCYRLATCIPSLKSKNVNIEPCN